jgi:hypothetical protein
MTDTQIIGTHNSYHAGLGPSEMKLLEQANPQAAASLAYWHPSLTQQLDSGVRKLELDVFGDAQGGLFANPSGILRVRAAGLPADPPYDPEGKLQRPGFKVIHVQDLDYRSHCLLLVDCLREVKAWSQRNPRHLPLYIMIENKDGRSRPEFMVAPEPITKATMDALDQEILSVFSREELITPDDVRRGRETLEEAVLELGWPELESARGKIVFLLDQERVTKLYTEGRPSLEGRIAFTNSTPGSPDAAFVKSNNPIGPGAARIRDLVRRGYLVRTMTDPGPQGVRAKDTRRAQSALDSGAQILSTDYPFSWDPEGYGYNVKFPDGAIARCNPVTWSAPCPALKE